MSKSDQFADLKRKIAGLPGLRQSLVREARTLDHAGVEVVYYGAHPAPLVNVVLRDRARQRQAVIQKQLADSCVAERVWRKQLRELTVVKLDPVYRHKPTTSAARTKGPVYLTRMLASS